VISQTTAAMAPQHLIGLHVCGIFCASGSTAPTRHEHEIHCRGSGAASRWVCRCRESPTTLPGVLKPRQAAWMRFLALRPAIRGRRASAASGRSPDGTGYGSAKMARKSPQKPIYRPPGIPPRYMARAGRGRGVRGAHAPYIVGGYPVGPRTPVGPCTSYIGAPPSNPRHVYRPCGPMVV